MNILDTPAISLKISCFNEADGIITFYTANYGLLKAVIKGIKKPMSKLAGASEILTLNNIFFVKGRSMHTLTSYERIESFGNIRQNLDRLSVGSVWIDIVRIIGKEHDPDSRQIYDLVAKRLADLDDLSLPMIGTSLAFHTDMLKLAGYLPAWTSCISCKKDLDLVNFSYYPFFVMLGGFVCQNCRVGFISLEGVNVSTGTIRLLISPDDIKFHNYNLKAHKFLAYYWNHRIEHEIKSFDFMLKLLENECNKDKESVR